MIFIYSSCSDENNKEATTTVEFQFDIQVDAGNVEFGNQKYSTYSGQMISLERLNFYLSNILFVSEDGTEYSELDSYHLISFNGSQGTVVLKIREVPSELSINTIQFSIGVDPDANASIDHVGDLDPTNGMAWDWNTGYKFLLLEGRFFDSDVSNGKEIKMHIGTDKNYHTKIFTLSEAQSLEYEYTFYFSVDALAPFGALDLSEGTVFMNDTRGDQVAENYKDELIQFNGFVYKGN